MTDPAQQLAIAARDAADARQRLSDTATVLRDRLRPARLVNDAREGVVDAGTNAARTAIGGAKRHPAGLAAAAAAAVLLLARHRIAGAFRRFGR